MAGRATVRHRGLQTGQTVETAVFGQFLWNEPCSGRKGPQLDSRAAESLWNLLRRHSYAAKKANDPCFHLHLKTFDQFPSTLIK